MIANRRSILAGISTASVVPFLPSIAFAHAYPPLEPALFDLARSAIDKVSKEFDLGKRAIHTTKRFELNERIGDIKIVKARRCPALLNAYKTGEPLHPKVLSLTNEQAVRSLLNEFQSAIPIPKILTGLPHMRNWYWDNKPVDWVLGLSVIKPAMAGSAFNVTEFINTDGNKGLEYSIAWGIA